ncbi:hypothetical protein AB0M54_10660 [Actinoplanes sp. NPDC051470]|uniref:hypothetical protein n=1 Tax=unclassified Actinoplanes TaxID=2626549 RepID=UPI00343911CC
MYPYPINTAADLRRDDLLRQAEQSRLVAQVRDPHQLRHRIGDALIRVGRRLADEPPAPASPVSRGPQGPARNRPRGRTA